MIKTKRPVEFPLISLLFVYFEHFLSRKPDNGIKTGKLTGLYSITIQREARHIEALINTRSKAVHRFQNYVRMQEKTLVFNGQTF